MQETLNRLQLKAQLAVGDAREPARWWDGKPFDAILLDAPCTASGIVRRHPDVRWLRRAGDATTLAHTQSQMLLALWPLLKPGGALVYATCSLFKMEGEQRIDAFLQRPEAAGAVRDPRAGGHLLPLPDNAGQADAGRASAGQDGFFYARLIKPATPLLTHR